MKYEEFKKMSSSMRSTVIMGLPNWRSLIRSYASDYTVGWGSSPTYKDSINYLTLDANQITKVNSVEITEREDKEDLIKIKFSIKTNRTDDYVLTLHESQFYPEFKVGSDFSESKLKELTELIEKITSATKNLKSLSDSTTSVNLTEIVVPSNWKLTPLETLKSLDKSTLANIFKESFKDWKYFLMSNSDHFYMNPDCNPYQKVMDPSLFDVDDVFMSDVETLAITENDISDIVSIKYDENKDIFLFSFTFDNGAPTTYLPMKVEDVYPNLKYGTQETKLKALRNLIEASIRLAQSIDPSFKI
jgi:hypothetical protein